jgi:hypothetical protein
MPRRCGVLLPAPSLCPRNPEPGNSPLVTPVFGLDGVQRVVKRLATVAGSGSGLFVRWVNPLTPAALPQRGEGRVEFRDLLGEGRMVRGGAYIVGRNRGHVFRFSRNQSDGHSCGSGLESKELLRVIGDQLARPASLCWNQPADSAVFTEGGGTGIVSVFRPISRSSRLFQGGVKPPHSKAFGTARPSGVKKTWLLRSLVLPFQGLGEPVTRGRDAGYRHPPHRSVRTLISACGS